MPVAVAPTGKARRRSMRVVPSAPSVVQQARLLDSAGTAWHAVKYGNLEMITKLFPNQSNVYDKGPVGENVLHMAMLLNTPSTLAIARYLIKLYGKALVNCPFQERKSVHDPPGAYEGETALHIAIVNHDFDMVKFLVQSGGDIRARAYGTFFQADGPMHYGEYPLSFAACTGQKDIVAYLKRHGAAVNQDHDVHGHTALHMCVFHNQSEMYDFLVEYCAASDAVVDHQGLTPLVLAAHLGKLDMFQHIYNKRRRAFYTFGKVTSYSLALREIDTVQDEGQYVPNALEVVVRKGHKELLEEPLLANLLKYKWDTFARWHFVGHAVGYLVLEVSQTVLIWLISDRTLWNSGYRASQEYVGFVLALLMAALEVMDYVGWSRVAYHRRLCMTQSAPYEPPLYPIPGECQDTSGARGGLFARLSARMGFPNARSSTDVQSPRLGRNNSEGNNSAMNTGAFASSSFAASAPRRHNSGDARLQGVHTPPSAPLINPVVPAATTLQTQKSLNRLNRPLSIYEGGTRQGSGDHSAAVASTRMGSVVAGPASVDDVASPTGVRLAASSTPAPSGRPVAEGTEAHVAFAEEDVGDVVSVGLSEGRMRSIRSMSDMRLVRPPNLPVAAEAAGDDSMPQRRLMTAPSAPVDGMREMLAAGAAGGASSSGAGPSSAAKPDMALAAQRQRTRARSGGGDVISNAGMLKRKDTLKRGDMDMLPAAETLAAPLRPSGERPSTEAAADMEAGTAPPPPPTDMYDVHKTHTQAFFETTRDGLLRLLEDPWLFVWHLHLVLTFVHFITWQSTYGGPGGVGPSSVAVRQFDDIVVSMMGLSGWLAVVYFFRGWEPTGKLAVILERCIMDVLRFISLYVLWNIGFALAFFTLQKGVIYVTNTPPEEGNTSTNPDEGAFSTIGGVMLSLISAALGSNPYSDYCNLGFQSAEVFCTIYYLLYLASVVLLLLNLLIAMIIKTHNTTQLVAQQAWRARWAIYVLKVERRLPARWLRTHRLGQLAWDPKTGRPVYSHVFEAVEEDPKEVEERLVKEQLRAAEGLLEFLKKRAS